jgi:hypothetical protein
MFRQWELDNVEEDISKQDTELKESTFLTMAIMFSFGNI